MIAPQAGPTVRRRIDLLGLVARTGCFGSVFESFETLLPVGRELVQPVPLDPTERLGVERVVILASVLVGVDEVRLAKHAQVLGDCGSADRGEAGRDLAGGEGGLLAEQVQDRSTCRVGDRAEDVIRRR
jgi:hypothetical protein